jgi:hypothetical protein
MNLKSFLSIRAIEASRRVLQLCTAQLCLAGAGNLPAGEVIARWAFDHLERAATPEEVSQQSDRMIGYCDPAEGVRRNAVQLDGYTSCLERPTFGRELPGRFTINAWVALESYPWFRSPVFDLRRAAGDGVVLGINQAGKLVMGMGQPETWMEMEGPQLPLREWLMLSVVADSGKAARLYLNGELVAETNAAPWLGATASHRLTLGRNALLEPWPDFQYTATNSFAFLDGRLDEVAVFGSALNAAELRQLFQHHQPLPQIVSPPRGFPAGPAGPPEFGANYTRLNYTRQWDRLWRVGGSPDVLVRFAGNRCRLVFWRGTSYVPCWVTEEDIW